MAPKTPARLHSGTQAVQTLACGSSVGVTRELLTELSVGAVCGRREYVCECCSLPVAYRAFCECCVRSQGIRVPVLLRPCWMDVSTTWSPDRQAEVGDHFGHPPGAQVKELTSEF